MFDYQGESDSSIRRCEITTLCSLQFISPIFQHGHRLPVVSLLPEKLNSQPQHLLLELLFDRTILLLEYDMRTTWIMLYLYHRRSVVCWRHHHKWRTVGRASFLVSDHPIFPCCPSRHECYIQNDVCRSLEREPRTTLRFSTCRPCSNNKLRSTHVQRLFGAFSTMAQLRHLYPQLSHRLHPSLPRRTGSTRCWRR